MLRQEEFWYRFEDVQYAASLNEYDEPCGPGRLAVELRKYKVLRSTPKGVWLDVYTVQRFVLKDANKRFACPTEAEAMDSFIARKKAQLRILNAQGDRVAIALVVAHRLIEERKLYAETIEGSPDNVAEQGHGTTFGA